jgi:dTDP-L-rhamnose 4-epimerase
MNNLVLITGGAGFIGQRVARRLLLLGDKVRILDNFNPQIHAHENLPLDISKNVELIKGDVRDRSALMDSLKNVTKIIHLAAETGTGQSMYEIERYFDVNVQSTAKMLDLLQTRGLADNLESIIVASSRAVYGEGAYECKEHGTVFPLQRTRSNMSAGVFNPLCPKCDQSLNLVPTSETAPFNPMSMYGLTKQVQEQAVLMFAQTREINGFGLRYQNVYGPGQSLKNPYTGILAVFSNLARQNQPIEIYEDGIESRDFVYIDDIVEATINAVNYKGKFIGALNVGSGKAVSVLEVAEAIKVFFKSECEIKITGAYRIGDIRHNVGSTKLLLDVLGTVPKMLFEDGLKEFLTWASSQPEQDKEAYLRSVNELSAHGFMGGSN